MKTLGQLEFGTVPIPLLHYINLKSIMLGSLERLHSALLFVNRFVENGNIMLRRQIKTNQQHEFEYNAIKTNQEHAQFVFEGILYKVGKNTSMSMHQHMIKHSCIDFLTRHQRDVWNLKVFEQFTLHNGT